MQPNNLQRYIRRVRQTDIKAVIKFLDSELTEEERYFFPCRKEELQAIIEGDIDVAYVVLSVMDNTIQAYGHMRTFNNKFEIPSLGIAVGKDFRGQGIGEELCRCMLYIAKAMGFRETLLKVNIINEKAAKLYIKLGFKEYKRDEVHIWMLKQL